MNIKNSISQNISYDTEMRYKSSQQNKRRSSKFLMFIILVLILLVIIYVYKDDKIIASISEMIKKYLVAQLQISLIIT